MSSNLPPVPQTAAVTDGQGRLTGVWSAWFRSLMVRVGGNVAETNLELATGAISTGEIADGAVTTPKLANASVTSAKIAAGAVTSTAMGAGSVTTSALGNSVVTSSNIATNAVATANIQDAAVTLTKVNTSGALTGQYLRYNGSSAVWDSVPIATGSGGQLVTDGFGDNEINISPAPTILVLQDSGAANWWVKVNTDGSLYTVSGATDPVTSAFKIQCPNGNYGQLGINTDGTLFVTEMPATTTVNNHCFLLASDNNLWQLALDNSYDIQTIEDIGANSRFSIVDTKGDVFFQIRSLPGFIALQYLRVLSASDLTTATPPPAVAGCLPLMFYNNGTAKKLIYHDGSIWRYVSGDTAV